MDSEAKREFEAQLAKRLAYGFEAVPWNGGCLLDFSEVGNWLGIDEGEVRLLTATGLLGAFDEKVEQAELLRFLEAHPRWFAWRGERQAEYLRRCVESRQERQAALGMADVREAMGEALEGSAP